jgi:Flp pilus assembly protein TadG
MMKRRINHQKQRGVAAVEFALLIIPMLLMVFGITEYGRAMYQYNTLVKSTRDAARFLTTQASGSGVDTAKCLAVYGQKVCSGPKVVANLNVSMVSVCDSVSCPATHAAVATGSGVVNLVTVVISGYQFESAVSFNVGGLSIGLPNVTFGDISTTMRQVL